MPGVVWIRAEGCVVLLDFFSPLILNSTQLHVNQQHPDVPLLRHVEELVAKLDALGVQPPPSADPGEEWEDVDDDDDDDGVVPML